MKFYFNLKIKTKVMLLSILLITISAIIGVVGTACITMLRQEGHAMYAKNTLPLSRLAELYDIIGSQRVRAGNMVIFHEADPEFCAAETKKLAEKEADFDAMFSSYRETISSPDELAIYDKVYHEYYVVFAPIKAELRRIVAEREVEAMPGIIRQVNNMGSIISGYVDEAVELNLNKADDRVSSNETLATRAIILQAAGLLLGVALGVLSSVFLSNIISKPMGRIMAITRQAGESGDLNFSQEQMASVRRDAQYTDETGYTAAAFLRMMDSLVEKVKILEQVSKGDLSVKVDKISNRDMLGTAIEDMTTNLNHMFAEIATASGQVSAGSSQITHGAQLLAHASVEQSSTVHELLSNLNEISEKTRENSMRADHAATLANHIKQNAEQGTTQMNRMTQAVADINVATSAISAVIKIIDDIAFQTNILALNAAVESAQAGIHGKGFAVVAGEVRLLAGKSAEAAKNTSSLIANTVEKAQLGAQIAKETSASLNTIVAGINETSAVVGKIAVASEEQNASISMVNQSIDQLNQTVQQNGATSQESAAAAEEMNNQALVLHSMLDRFTLQAQPQKFLPDSMHATPLPANERSNERNRR